MPIQIIRQDITKMRVDAIVNTTNSQMIGYSGLDLAVHKKGGAELDEACKLIAPIGVGEAKITAGYGLPSKFIIHTAGPVWQGGERGERDLLSACYINSMKLAIENGCESIAFPLISSGVYGFPRDIVLRLAMQTVTDFLFDNELDVYICVFDSASYELSRKLSSEIQKFIDDEYVSSFETEICSQSVADPSRLSSNMALCKRIPRWEEELSENKTKEVSLDKYVFGLDKSFQEKLFHLIDKKGMTDVECYKRANVDKRTFSKIKSNRSYQPSKNTAVAFAISLQLNMEETLDLLETVGYTLSKSRLFDVIIRFFIENKRYDVIEINETLFEYDLSLLGNSAK